MRQLPGLPERRRTWSRPWAAATLLLWLAGPLAGAEDSAIGIGSGNQPPSATQTQDGQRVIGVPPSSTTQHGGDVVGNMPGTPPPAPDAASLSEAQALYAVHELALNHPNPDVRAAASHDHDLDWNVNTQFHTFSLVLRDPDARFVAGTFHNTGNAWSAQFIDNESLANPWTPPASDSLTQEQARGLLQDMCNSRADEERLLRAMGQALESAEPEPAQGATFSFKSGSTFQCAIDPQARTFHMSQTSADGIDTVEGKFGWDKNKSWTAWPVIHTHASSTDAAHPQTSLMIPGLPKPSAEEHPPSTAPASAPATSGNASGKLGVDLAKATLARAMTESGDPAL